MRYVIRYAARGPISQKRAKRLEDGPPFTLSASKGAQLVPPKGLHLTVGHVVFAPRHSLRDKVTGREEADAPEESAPAKEAGKRNE